MMVGAVEAFYKVCTAPHASARVRCQNSCVTGSPPNACFVLALRGAGWDNIPRYHLQS